VRRQRSVAALSRSVSHPLLRFCFCFEYFDRFNLHGALSSRLRNSKTFRWVLYCSSWAQPDGVRAVSLSPFTCCGETQHLQQHNYLPLQCLQDAVCAGPARVAQCFSADFVLVYPPSANRVATSTASIAG